MTAATANHKQKNHNRPVHIDGRGHGRDGEEIHHEAHGQKTHGGIVDGGAPFAEGPAPRAEGFVAETFETDAADGGHVGEDEGGVGERDNGVEGDVGAEVEAGNQEGDEEGGEDCVGRDIHARAELEFLLLVDFCSKGSERCRGNGLLAYSM